MLRMETRVCSVALVTRACSVVQHDTNPLLARVPLVCLLFRAGVGWWRCWGHFWEVTRYWEGRTINWVDPYLIVLDAVW